MEHETIMAFQKQLTLENINKCVNSLYCVVSLQKIKNTTRNKFVHKSGIWVWYIFAVWLVNYVW